jgi:tight adherence protein C
MMVQAWLLWVPPILAASGVGLLVHYLLAGLADLARRGLFRRRRRVAWALSASETDDAPDVLAEEELYDVPDVALWMPVLAGLGLLLTMALLDGPVQVAGLAAGLLPMAWKRRKIALGQHEVRRQVVALIEAIRLRLAFGGNLGTALRFLADEPGHEGILYERLRAYRDLMTVRGPEIVLERLAADLRSADLTMLLRRVRAARRGGATYEDALRSATAEVTEETTRRAEMEVEGAPLRLLLPMLVFLLPPVLAVVLYPPAYDVIEQLTGTGFGGAGF